MGDNMSHVSKALFFNFLLVFSAAVFASEVLTEDTATTTVRGNELTAPAEWKLSVRGAATIFEAPEGGSFIALVDVDADNQDDAIDKAWSAYGEMDRPLKVTNDSPDSDGWSKQRRYEYQTSPNERRAVIAGAMYSGESWTVWIYDMADDVRGKRGAQVNLLLGSLVPKGYSRESFAGKQAKKLDEGEIAALSRYIEDSQEVTGVPGVSVGIVQDGKVVFAGGFGVREFGKPSKVDAETRYLIASNTKGLTTLLLAKLVDAGKLDWNTTVTDLMPSFRLGNDETTASVLVEHLICACTGLPRKDMELIFQFDGLTAADAMNTLAEVQPTTAFGEMFQYSNGLAAAAGYIAGHVLYPDLELGAAYDQAMQTEVFDPLAMSSTTFDFDVALRGEYAKAHSADINGDPSEVFFGVNYAVEHVRPAGAAWSTVNDMLKYIQMELDAGLLPNGDRYISAAALLERREPKVPIGEHHYYGMGLMVDEIYGVPVVHHGGDVFGHHSDMMWLPEHGVGAIVLTNGDPGWLIRTGFRRKLLEVLFDGEAEADESIASAGERYFTQLAAERELLDLPVDSDAADNLAARYVNGPLGNITVSRDKEKLIFDFDEWKSEVASRVNLDESISFITISPGVTGFEFVVGEGDEPTLIMRDAQHEYVFEST